MSNDYNKLQRDYAALQVENERLKALCVESLLQIEYLHGKFQETGSGNNVLARLRSELFAERTP